MEELLKALSQIGKLKDLPRAGWMREQVPHPESVADHSFRAMVLALVLGPQLGVDVGKVLRLLLVHDLAESDPTVGDITPFDGVAPEEKHRRELAAMEQLCSALPDGEEVLSLWREYDEGTSPEASVAKQLDALEMALQATEYEQRYGKGLKGFLESARRKIRHPVLVQILERLSSRRTGSVDRRSEK
ncbi:MAG: HD domain-containing protein [Planctomycetes bacterium]|nr:HD domain-containing protein [Planctomycetota bacterium]